MLLKTPAQCALLSRAEQLSGTRWGAMQTAGLPSHSVGRNARCWSHVPLLYAPSKLGALEAPTSRPETDTPMPNV
eukprot:1734761-Pyramimonas_sp.AAC.1